MDLKLQTYVKLLNFTKQGRQALLWESAFLFSVKQRTPTHKGVGGIKIVMNCT